MIAWYWGLINALLVSLVIYMNGREWRSGWAAGVLAQAWIIAFGLVNGAWTFAFSTIPLVMFVYNWIRHPKRHPKTLDNTLYKVVGADGELVGVANLDTIYAALNRIASENSGELSVEAHLMVPVQPLVMRPMPVSDEEFAELKRQFRERLNQADRLIDQGVRILPVPPKTVTFERPKDDTP
jgi:hypothetical protein